MKRENVAKSYMVKKKLAKTKKNSIYCALLAKDRYTDANVSPSERLITLVWALINQLSAINRLR